MQNKLFSISKNLKKIISRILNKLIIPKISILPPSKEILKYFIVETPKISTVGLKDKKQIATINCWNEELAIMKITEYKDEELIKLYKKSFKKVLGVDYYNHLGYWEIDDIIDCSGNFLEIIYDKLIEMGYTINQPLNYFNKEYVLKIDNNKKVVLFNDKKIKAEEEKKEQSTKMTPTQLKNFLQFQKMRSALVTKGESGLTPEEWTYWNSVY